MISTAVQQEVVPQQRVIPQNSRTGRLPWFFFQPPRVGPIPLAWVAAELAGVAALNGFATRLATSPADLVTYLGMARSNACHDAGCAVGVCDHAAAWGLWRVIYPEAIEFGPVVTPRASREMEGLCI